ncbi:Alpha/Beta hydrolase protein [Powellomyces hirtus]|nr:Alpha/Beta hydrolase protein [Powellomyces hirtus]
MFRKPPRPHSTSQSSLIGGSSGKSSETLPPCGAEAPSIATYFDSTHDVTVPASNGTFRVYQNFASSGPLFIFHHGAGHTSLSWALVAKLLKNRSQPCSVLCYDCRGHGATQTDDDSDLSLTRLSGDLVNILDVLYETLPADIILVGHSMGGAVVVDAAASKAFKSLLGVVVIDVVEGTAMESLAHMQVYLRNRPASFASIREAVDWSTLGTIKNRDSARISVPSQLKEATNKDGAKTWVWRADLNASQVHWKEWFQGLSKKFLSARAARLLILAGTDRLDTELTIGQMQGKYQLVLYPESGHTIQEDEPEKLTSTLWEFWDRNGPGKIIKRFPIPIPVKSVAAPASAPEH